MVPFVLRMRFVSVVILWLFRLELIVTSIGNADEIKGGKKHYRTSDFGRRFLFAIPDRPDIQREQPIVAKLIFMTYEYEASVTVTSPLSLTNRDANYTESNFLTTNTMPITFSLPASNITRKSGTGNAMKITADRDILVYAIFWGALENDRAALVLPPTNSYASSYTVILPANGPAFLLTLADHEYTIVTFSFTDDTSSFETTCDWNSTCITGRATPPSRLVLNATKYSFVTWGRKDRKSGTGYVPRLSGCTISSSRPVLVIGGMSLNMATAVMFRPSSFSKRFPFTLDCVRTNGAGKQFSCNDIEYNIIPKILDIAYSIMYYRTTKLIILTVTPGKSHVLHQVDEVEFITSSVPIAVMIHHHYPPTKVYNILVPEIMWFSYTMFSKPDALSTLTFILQLIIHTDVKEGLLYNGRSLASSPWERMKQFDLFPYEHMNQVMNESVVTLMQRDPRHTFMAYIRTVNASIQQNNSPFTLATSLGMTYHHPDNMTKYGCLPQNATLRTGDDVDNDCDNDIDEELWNGKDDDGDGLIDEDIATERISGEWGAWLSWHCGVTCPSKEEGRLQRYKPCGNPPQQNKGGTCSGSNLERGDTACKLQCSSIPESCALGLFGKACDGACPPHCAMPFCGREKGRCAVCKPGYRQPPSCQHLEYEPPSHLNMRNRQFPTVEQAVALCVFLLILIFIVIAMRRHKAKKDQKKEAMEDTHDVLLSDTYHNQERDTHGQPSEGLEEASDSDQDSFETMV